MKKIILPLLIFCLTSVKAHSASAVAYGEDAYGYAYNVKTIEEAEELAKKACAKHGGRNIIIIASSKGMGYGAIAVYGKIAAAAVGFPTIYSAMSRAEKECMKFGGNDPHIVATWYDYGGLIEKKRKFIWKK